jgi:asparagine synthase (glutamine-hydrolysing)
MCEALIRRGPDDQGMHIDGPLGLGMRRLSIIDVAGGHQPLTNEDGTLWIVYNGEVFNHEALQADLKRRGHCFKTRSDTETILHLYEEEGPACLRHLRGMFAFAIWNSRARSLFIARDRLGIKPLHYFTDGRRIVFGSEIKALLKHPQVPRDLDWTGIDAFFTYGYVPAPWTAYKGIRKLESGSYLIVTERGIRQEQYWDLPFGPKLRASERDLEHELLDRLREAVRMRLLSEVPLGAFLSGGIDSSLVVALMAETSAARVSTFTIGFGGGTGTFLDERPFAREISQMFRTDHHVFEVQPEPGEAIDRTLAAFDEPFADDSLIPTHHICAEARRHVTVALTGLGGDENFAGYERYLGFQLSRGVNRWPWRPAARAVRPLVNRLREQRGGHYRVNHVKRFLEGADLPEPQRWQRYSSVFPQEERRLLYKPEIAREVDFDAVDRAGWQHFDRLDAADPLDRALYQDIKMYLPDDILALTDRVGMAHSLELRVPFVDHTFVEFCARLPIAMKLKRGRKKYLLRQAAGSILPASVLNHRKQGFAAPTAMWLRGRMRPFVDQSLSREAVDEAGVLLSSEVTARLDAHQTRRRLNDRQIFAMLMFQRWWRQRS